MTQALEAGTVPVRRRRLFGLLDADGWGWATIKAFFWLIVLILLLGYIPDRAYYFVVNRTIDVGLLAWSPINFCPPENQTLPCPAPHGAVLPWQVSPQDLALPAPRSGGSVVQLGSKILYVGGSDASGKPTDTVYVGGLTSDGNFTAWQAGTKLPEARTGTALAVAGGKLYAFGGSGPGGATNTVWTLEVDANTGALGSWTALSALNLPAPRAGAAAASLSDGIVLVGGADSSGKPTATTWKTTLDAKGVPGAWADQAAVQDPISGATAVQVGDYLWLVGGTDASGPTGAVQRGSIGTGIPPAPAGTYVNPNAPPAPLKLLQWGISNPQNLPGPRAGAAIFTANGSIYVVGGSDAQGPRNELFWAVPSGKGDIPEWHHLEQTDLAGGLTGGAAIVNGPTAFVVGGSTKDGVLASSLRANLAPQQPFFQLGLFGATVPALRLEGELGQQLGMLSAGGAFGTMFAILVFIGWLLAHRAQVRAWVERRRTRRSS